MVGIYKIISPSGKVYIGQATDIIKRWDNNYKNLCCKGQIKLFNSLNKYGWEAHTKEIIEECLTEQLNERETYYKQFELDKVGGDFSKVLFCNLYDIGSGPLSEETKRKIGEAHKGSKRSDETKLKMKDAHIKRVAKLRQTRKGGHLFENNKERCLKIGQAQKGKLKNMTEQGIINKSEKLKGNQNKKGKTCTEEQCNNISNSKIGYKASEETKLKMSLAKKGKPLSNEHILALRESKKNK